LGGLSRNDRPVQGTSEVPNRNLDRRQRNLPVSRGALTRQSAAGARPSMIIAARLGPLLLTRLRIVAGEEYGLIETDSWANLREVVRGWPVQVAVVDPCADGPEDALTAKAIDAIRGIARTVTVFIYAPLTPAATRAMLALSADGIKHFVIGGVDDDATRFRERLEEFRAPGMEEEVLAPLLTALSAARVPAVIGNGMRTLFRTPRRFQTAEDVAARVGVTRQYFNRCLAEAGLVPVRIMVVAARVLRAYQYAQVPGLTLADVASRLRYTDTRTLTRHVRELTGTTLASWSSAVTPVECVAQIRARLGIGASKALVLLGGAERDVQGTGTGA
jgi:AraC-like DNA-binding protein